MQLLFSGLLALVVGLVIGGPVIKKLKDYKMAQQIRALSSKEHLKKKGTPTMGGLIFIIATSLVSLIFNQLKDQNLYMILGMLLFGLIGLLDDTAKIKQQGSDGLSAKGKLAMNLVFSIVMAWLLNPGQTSYALKIPFVGATVDLALPLYYLFIIVFYTAVTNSVNLTDGLDGLCASVSLVVAGFYVAYGLKQDNLVLAIFAAALAGALLAYLFFNWYPARVMMGDTGSFALGGALATMAILSKSEILMLITGLIYVIEALSVILQVSSYKLRGKRLFPMAPIHHSLEKLGWSEVRIVGFFTLITLIMCCLAYFLA